MQQDNSFCPWLFTLCLNPIAWNLKATEGYKLSKPISLKITDLLYIEDLKGFAASESKLPILDKTVEKIVYLGSIFLNIVAVPVLPSPPSPESNVVVYSKESLIPGRLWEATLDWRKGFSCRKGVVLEIALLRRRVDQMGKTFSSSFVQDCI